MARLVIELHVITVHVLDQLLTLEVLDVFLVPRGQRLFPSDAPTSWTT
jgi:hypothetical protein